MKDQYLINMRFAEELLQFLCSEDLSLFEFKIRWKPKFPILDIQNGIDGPLFYDGVGWAVYSIIMENLEEIEECFEEFCVDIKQYKPANDINDSNFARCALKIAPSFFSKGYSHESFFAYCAMVIGVAYNFLLLKPNCVPQRACEVVALVLFNHQMTGQFHQQGGWKGFRDKAFDFNESIAALHKTRSWKN